MQVKLVTVVYGDPKAPFLIATTVRCREGANPCLRLLHFTLDPYLIMLSVMKGDINYNFWVFGMTRPRIELRSPRPLANALTIRLMVVIKQSITEWKITKREIGNEMEIFIALTKYNTCLLREEGNRCLWWLLSIFSPPHSNVQRIYEEWDIPINVHR